MSTGAIIAIVAGVVIVLILLALLWRMTSHRREHRRLVAQRKEVASAHRDAAQEKATRAEVAEREARHERAEAELHEARAKLHEQGLADDELDRDRTTSEAESESGRPVERH